MSKTDSSSSKIKVLYFTAIPLGEVGNGGSLCCRSHVQRMADDQSIDLIVVTAGTSHQNRQASESLKGHAAKVVSIDLLPTKFLADKFKKLGRKLKTAFGRLPLEEWVARFPGFDRKFLSILNEENPDIVIVDYLYCVQFVPSVKKTKRPFCVITLNPESSFIRSGLLAPKRIKFKDRILLYRVRRFEKKVISSCDGVIALNQDDLESCPASDAVRAVIPPYLDVRPQRWHYQGTRRLFFVGNFAHYPNRLAVDWICNRLAPALEEHDPSIRFSVVGGAAHDVPMSWRRSNVDFLGTSDGATVLQNFISADLFIAPIENSFGSKIKLLECLSHGTPFLASHNALSGLPFLQKIPVLDLSKPDETADLILALINDPSRLRELQSRITLAFEEFRQTQQGVWGNFFRRVSERHSLTLR